MTFLNVMHFLSSGLTGRIFSVVLTLVVGLIVIRTIMRLLKNTLEKSKLEKAAHSLILSLVRTVL